MYVNTNILGLLVLSFILVVLTVLKESGLATKIGVPDSIETAVTHPIFEEAMAVYTEILRRGIPGIIIFTVIMMQILIGSQVLSEERAHELSTLFYVGSVEFGVYTLLSVLLLAWVFAPFARFWIRSVSALAGLREFPGMEGESGA